MQPPVAAVREPGPWTHQDVSAAGASFHVASSGEGPHAVLLLHDFPMYWWQWRHQLPTLASAGHRAVAMDLRGFGGSDYQPGDVDLSRLATDVSATAQSLGITSYTLVGAGMGGTVGWMVAASGDAGLHSLITVGSPHPRARTSKRRSRTRGEYWRNPPGGPRSLQDGALVAELLPRWAAPQNRTLMENLVEVYSAPMERHFAAESAWETLRGTRKLRASEKRALTKRVEVPVWTVRGSADKYCRAQDLAETQEFAVPQVRHFEVDGSGHFVSEERPEALTEILLQHLEATL